MSAYTARNHSSSSASSRASSSASSISTQNNRRSSSITAPFKSLGRKLAQHNREVTAAYEAYYGGSLAGPTAAAVSHSAPRKSEESEMTLVSEPEKKQQEQKVETKWQMLKRRAKEHNEGVNNAYRAYYGITWY